VLAVASTRDTGISSVRHRCIHVPRRKSTLLPHDFAQRELESVCELDNIGWISTVSDYFRSDGSVQYPIISDRMDQYSIRLFQIGWISTVSDYFRSDGSVQYPIISDQVLVMLLLLLLLQLCYNLIQRVNKVRLLEQQNINSLSKRI
jgi:hypothetical protein